MIENTSNTVLNTDELSIGYSSKKGDTVIADAISFKFKKGELVGLVGINGSGKSTLLRTLAGLQSEISGSIKILEEQIKNIPNILLAKQLSVVLTTQPISKNLSVVELVTLGRHPYTNWVGSISPIDKDIILQALRDTETLNLKDKKCYELSDGQLQRVLIARALAQDTDIIMLDEPMTHLDLHHKAAVLKLLSTIAQTKNKTILFSTHDIEYALNICDKIVVMKDGKAIFGTPDYLIDLKVFDTLFPSKNVTFDKENRIFFLK